WSLPTDIASATLAPSVVSGLKWSTALPASSATSSPPSMIKNGLCTIICATHASFTNERAGCLHKLFDTSAVGVFQHAGFPGLPELQRVAPGACLSRAVPPDRAWSRWRTHHRSRSGRLFLSPQQNGACSLRGL